ncbi:MAG TPA: ABC transporter permease, partial [Blastocatellia bacterium]|nr:ABC transporter permease [Blastocatellia bacterium]
MPDFSFKSLRIGRYKRELSAAIAYIALLALVGFIAPAFFSAANWRDLAMNNVSVLIVAIGMTFVIIAGQIDISVGSQFAICSIASGLLAKAGFPMLVVAVLVIGIGGLLGAINGALIAKLKIPAIVVTLATLVALRDALRWITEGAWVQGLPDSFQWFGLSQLAGQLLIALIAAAVFLIA